MKTKAIILAAALVLPATGLFAELTTEIREDFEKIVPTVKGLDKYYMNHIRDGWDFGRGPVVFHPTMWRPNCGSAGRFYAIDCSVDEALKPFVHSGIGSLKVGVKDVKKGGVHIMRNDSMKPGKYRLSVWTKGTGKLSFCTYNYFGPGDGRIETRSAACDTKPSADWTKTEKVISCGADVEGAKSSTFAFAVTGGDVYIDDLDLVPVSE